ncbi:MAG TPA: hypothetical protein VGC93_02130 [Thermoanaerobaculia bacterium]
MNCDVCSTPIDLRDFYILHTTDVAYSPDYWDTLVQLHETLRPGHLRDDRADFYAEVMRISLYRSNWAICPACIDLFATDRKKARRWAVEYAAHPQAARIPETAPVDSNRTLAVAQAAMERRYGAGSERGRIATKAASTAQRALGGPRTVVVSEEIGTRRANFWRLFKKTTGL